MHCGDYLGARERACGERIDELAVVIGKPAERQPDLIGNRALGGQRGRKAQLVKWVRIAKRADGRLFRQGGASCTDQNNVVLSRESGKRQHEKLRQITHPIGTNLAPVPQ
jgi:hypothetical protein